MEELPHIRCITCGKEIASKWEVYNRLLEQGVPIKEALDRLGLHRYCCRIRMMNPFKVSSYADRQIDIGDTGVEEQMKSLTVSTEKEVDTIAPLQQMQQPTTSYVVLPQTSTVDLPSVPTVDLPDLTDVSQRAPARITKTYQAW
jgi:DNA-directed RNA polymerase subunit N (RpoN/RPB10)